MITQPPPGVASPPPIHVAGLCKRYGAVTAVANASFDVPAGSITGLIGPNGSGKTTTMRMLLGLTVPTSGVGLIAGRRFSDLGSPARVVGAVLDNDTRNGRRTAIDHLRVYCAAIGVPDAHATQMLDVVGLAPAARRKIKDFSLGMTQRLMLASAMLGHPSILVLDEPTNGLDPEGIQWIRHFLQDFAAKGGTVLLSSHNLREIQATVDRVVVINQGSTRFVGSIEEMGRLARGHEEVLVTCADPVALREFALANGIQAHPTPDGRVRLIGIDRPNAERLATDAGVTVFALTASEIDLEQVFIQLTHGEYTAGGTR